MDLEPSGEPFNEISLDPVTERPRNPMINAGAITCASLIEGDSPSERFERVRSWYSRFAGRELRMDERMFASEDRTGHRNRAIGHMLRSFGILDEDPESALAVYFRQCSIEVNCRDLSLMAATLADAGVNPVTGDRVLDSALVERVLSVMTTCGMYDAAGSWVARVGLPAKSGVGGGIIAVLPGQLGLAVFSPRLDSVGNSVRGVRACRRLSRDLELHFLHVTRAGRAAIRASYDIVDAPSRRRRSAAEQELLQRNGRRARVFELHGDLLFAGAESVVRQIQATAGDVDVMILDLRMIEDIADVAARMFLNLRDELRAAGVEVIIIDPFARVIPLDPDPEARVRHFPDLNTAIEYAEDDLIRRFGGGEDLIGVEAEQHPLLSGLPDEQLRLLLDRMSTVTYADGELLASAGEPPHGLFLLLAGLVEVTRTQGTRRHHLTTFAPGTTFGTIYTVDDRPYDVDARARGSVEARLLPSEQFAELGRLAPDLALTLQRRLLIEALEPLEWATTALMASR